MDLVLIEKYIDHKEEYWKRPALSCPSFFLVIALKKGDLKVELEKDQFLKGEYSTEKIIKAVILTDTDGYLIRHCSEMSFSFFWYADTDTKKTQQFYKNFCARFYFLTKESTSMQKPLNTDPQLYMGDTFIPHSHL